MCFFVQLSKKEMSNSVFFIEIPYILFYNDNRGGRMRRKICVQRIKYIYLN